jgi:serine/threonine-protein phosphatase 5
MDFMKDGKVLHRKYAVMLLLRVREILEAEKTLQYITIPDDQDVTVCGDVHGQFYDLLNIFKLNGNPSANNPYLYNGDFVDRGSFSVEVMMTLLAWKVALPTKMLLNRGNHEAKQLNHMYGFEGEVKHKYNDKTMDLFTEIFCYLPIVHVINKKIFITHGGLFSKDGVKLADIEAIHRKKEPESEGLMCELLWSDPSDIDGRQPSKRGCGIAFGPDVTEKFLKENDLSKSILFII